MFGSVAPMDKGSLRVLSAFNYLKLREEEEIEKVRAEFARKGRVGGDVEIGKVTEKVRARFRAKERELFRRAAGPLAKIIDG